MAELKSALAQQAKQRCCWDGVVGWLESAPTRTLAQHWVKCERGDWMVHLAGRFHVPPYLTHLATLACVESAINEFARSPIEDRFWREDEALLTPNTMHYAEAMKRTKANVPEALQTALRWLTQPLDAALTADLRRYSCALDQPGYYAADADAAAVAFVCFWPCPVTSRQEPVHLRRSADVVRRFIDASDLR